MVVKKALFATPEFLRIAFQSVFYVSFLLYTRKIVILWVPESTKRATAIKRLREKGQNELLHEVAL